MREKTTEYVCAVDTRPLFRESRIVRITRAGLDDRDADVETILDHVGAEEGHQIARALQDAYDRGRRSNPMTYDKVVEWLGRELDPYEVFDPAEFEMDVRGELDGLRVKLPEDDE